MRLSISGLNELRQRLERLRPEEVMARALAEEAERMAERVREGLSEPSGAADHDRPWLQSGALWDSVGAQADGLQAVVGSSDAAAVPQELGTAKMQPRPFFAPVAASMGEEAAQAIGARVAAALRGGESGAGAADPNVIQASSTSTDSGIAVLGVLGILGFLALRGRPSNPNSHDPTRASPLMNQSSPDESNSPENEGDHSAKPEYRPNEAHNRRSSRFNPNKDPEPSDAEEVYQGAERDPKPQRRTWYGQNANGEWYQYHEDNVGGAHYAGTVSEQDVPISIRRGRK